MTTHKPTPPDVDDTTNCPIGPCCASCQSTDDLAVGTVATPVGVYCVTLCGDCADGGRLPLRPIWSVVCDSVAAHCAHLGIDVDQMAAALPGDTHA